MKKLEVSSKLEEKIYDAKFPYGGKKGKITSYFPLTLSEKQEICSALRKSDTLVEFKSIFSDVVSDADWYSTKEQIKKKFQDELIDIE
jgi:NTP pyrophosphatase (non-canonical NTP hydrolase)